MALLLAFLFVGEVNAEQCFTVDMAHGYVTQVGGRLVYETQNQAAVSLALKAVGDTKKADRVRVYVSPNGTQGAVMFYVGQCLAREDGGPAVSDTEGKMYVLPAEQTGYLVHLMNQAVRRSLI